MARTDHIGRSNLPELSSNGVACIPFLRFWQLYQSDLLYHPWCERKTRVVPNHWKRLGQNNYGSPEERIRNETLGNRRSSIIRFEVWKGSLVKSIWNTFTVKHLLTDRGNHLTDVDLRTFGSAQRHDQGTEGVRSLLSVQTCCVEGALSCTSCRRHLWPLKGRHQCELPKFVLRWIRALEQVYLNLWGMAACIIPVLKSSKRASQSA